MPPSPPPPDEAARRRITTDLATTLFVEAGAGSGKTTALVARIVALVEQGVALRDVAAITFTEKAAAELRARARTELEGHPAALEQLDGAAIGTLHAFAQRLLREHPVEAGLPPRVAVLDEVASAVAFEHRWDRFRAELLADPDVALTLQLALAAGVTMDHLRELARVFDDNWDLVAARLGGGGPTAAAPVAGIAPVLATLDAVGDWRPACSCPDDPLLVRLDQIAAYTTELRAVADDPIEVLARTDPDHPQRPGFKVGNVGRKPNWRDGCVADVRDAVHAAAESIERWRQRVADQVLQHLGRELARFTLAAATARQADGRLEFHDLLVLARQVLRDPTHGPRVREQVHRRYRRLLIDEFQDTDPLQVELAVLIAAPPTAAVEGIPWQQVPVDDGHLFFVGDPKQSIYRFRRADIALFLDAQARFGQPTVHLDANFRTVEPVLRWVNDAFSLLIQATQGAQPPYQALRATRTSPEPYRHRVVVLGADPHPDAPRADELRRREAADVVLAIRTALAEGWPVHDGSQWRPAELGDIAVLLPSRLSLDHLEDALDEAGVAYRAEASSLVYASRAIRDLLAAARAVDDPSDELSLVTALRSPLFGCGDDDLYRWRRVHGGAWHHQVPAPAGIAPDDPVASAMATLGAMHRAAPWLTPSEVLDGLVRERRVLESALAGPRPADLWRRVRFVIDQARAWSEAEHGSLREWLRWVARQTDEAQRAGEALLPETDTSAVRILTVHAAKGLEFPVTILSGMSTRAGGRRPGVAVTWHDGDVQLRLGRTSTTEYQRGVAIDEQLDHHERLRLLYVACTRARDHLVVSLHRTDPTGDPSKWTAAQLVADAVARSGTDLRRLEPGRPLVPAPVRPEPAPSPLVPFGAWHLERTRRLDAGSRPRTIAATALAPPEPPAPAGEADVQAGLDKRARDLDLPPWLKGRYGTATGRAVHAVLQTVDLRSGEGLVAAVAAQCAAEGIIGHEATVGRLAEVALRSPVVRRAAALPHWREVYVAVPVGATLLEGYLDLLVRTAGGLVVVDYKTSASADPAELDRRLTRYRWQGGAYALAAEAVTGEPVLEVVFVFCTPRGAVERPLPDLAGAVADVRDALTSGAAAEQARHGFLGLAVELDQDEPDIG